MKARRQLWFSLPDACALVLLEPLSRDAAADAKMTSIWKRSERQ